MARKPSNTLGQLDWALLKAHATPKQVVYLTELESTGQLRPAARNLGISVMTLKEALRSAKARAARVEPVLHQTQAPPGYRLRGVSTLLDATGVPVQTWVKTTRDQEDPRAFVQTFREALEQDPLPTRAPSKGPSTGVEKLLTVYPMGDPHVGMLCWHAETGVDFDLKIAESNLAAAVDRLVGLAPASEEALIVNLGDFLHADSAQATTTKGTRVDVDSRWAKVFRAGVGMLVRIVDRALEKHAHVRLINEIGNHDTNSSVMLAICLDHHYRDEPRVSVDTSPAKFHWYTFGQNLIGVTHGDTVKLAALPGIMATDQARAWGHTKHRYWYTGHVHTQRVFEYPGCVVESFNTLAPRDAWTSGQGYRSRQGMVCDVLHADRGRILRHEVGVEELDRSPDSGQV